MLSRVQSTDSRSRLKKWLTSSCARAWKFTFTAFKVSSSYPHTAVLPVQHAGDVLINKGVHFKAFPGMINLVQTTQHSHSLLSAFTCRVCEGITQNRWLISPSALPVSAGGVFFLRKTCLFSFSFSRTSRQLHALRVVAYIYVFIYWCASGHEQTNSDISLSSHHRHGSRMRPAVRPTSCLPICNRPQSHFLSDKQVPYVLGWSAFTSFPHTAHFPVLLVNMTQRVTVELQLLFHVSFVKT